MYDLEKYLNYGSYVNSLVGMSCTQWASQFLCAVNQHEDHTSKHSEKNKLPLYIKYSFSSCTNNYFRRPLHHLAHSSLSPFLSLSVAAIYSNGSLSIYRGLPLHSVPLLVWVLRGRQDAEDRNSSSDWREAFEEQRLREDAIITHTFAYMYAQEILKFEQQ